MDDLQKVDAISQILNEALWHVNQGRLRRLTGPTTVLTRRAAVDIKEREAILVGSSIA